MKQVIRCGGCNKVIRRNGSFTAELEEEQMVWDEVAGLNRKRMVKTKIKLCRPCADEAGYKVRGGTTFTRDDMARAYFKGVHDDEVKEESMKELGLGWKNQYKAKMIKEATGE